MGFLKKSSIQKKNMYQHTISVRVRANIKFGALKIKSVRTTLALNEAATVYQRIYETV